MEKMNDKRGVMDNKRGQVTIFVIIALVIVVILVIAFYPQIKKAVLPKSVPELIPLDCFEKNVKEGLDKIMVQGGSLNPQLYFMYNNKTLSYLCYTGEWYKTCVMQKPLLKQEIEKEVQIYSQTKINSCIDGMINTLKGRGYDIKLTGNKDAKISIEPGRILVSPDIQLILERGEDKIILESNRFIGNINSKAYDIIMIASAIENYEARYGDSSPDTFMALYPNIKIQKLKQSDGTKVYIIEDRETKEKLQFATRSLAWPPGFAMSLEFQENAGENLV